MAAAGEPRRSPVACYPRPLFPLFCILVLFALLCAITAATRLVAPNEGWFADPAYHLATEGVFRTTVLETSGTWLEGLNRHTYWILPLYPLTQAALFHILGFSLLIMRAGSVFWGAVALAAFYFLMRSRAGEGVTLLATLLVATDFHFVVAASVGRMDMMCAALGFSALAAYMTLRERSYPAAVIVSHSLAVAACFTHPCGALAAGGLVLLALQFDRKRWGRSSLALALAPYAIAIAAYSVYALADLPSFVRQLTGNVSGLAGEATGTTRFSGLLHPLSALRRELLDRYVAAFNGGSWRNPYQAQIVPLALYWGGAIVAAIDRKVREQQAARLLLPLAGPYFVAMWLFEGLKQRVYLVHTIPLLAGLGALWIWNWTEHRKPARYFAVAAVLGAQLLGIGAGVRENQYRNEYLQAAAYLKQHGPPNSLIMGPGQLAFEFGFDARLVDDVRLGFFSGKTPEFYVQDPWYEDWLKHSSTREPAVFDHVTKTLAGRYREMYQNTGYRVWQKALARP